MYSYTATIGRNKSTSHEDASQRGEVLTLTQWQMFVEDVEAELRSSAFERQIVSVEVHYGKGAWQGVEEESAKVTMLTRSWSSEAAVENLKRGLRVIAGQYGQDAIALTRAESELIEPLPIG